MFLLAIVVVLPSLVMAAPAYVLSALATFAASMYFFDKPRTLIDTPLPTARTWLDGVCIVMGTYFSSWGKYDAEWDAFLVDALKKGEGKIVEDERGLVYLMVRDQKVDIWSAYCFGMSESCKIVRPSLKTVHLLAQIRAHYDKEKVDDARIISRRSERTERHLFISKLYEPTPSFEPSLDIIER